MTQEQLKLGAEVLAIPLAQIINNSITEGKFPEIWKIGVVTPVLKKGSPLEKNNYGPVSCLSVLSKVLEKIVCEQITGYMEETIYSPKISTDLDPVDQQCLPCPQYNKNGLRIKLKRK